MAVEKDQSAWLPQPPPPRPARRDAAIETALRKFDGVEDAAAPEARREPRRSWASTHRPQFAMLVSVMLLVVVGIPAALIGIRNQPSMSDRAPPAAAARNVEVPNLQPAPAPATEAPPSVPAVQPPPVRKHSGADGNAVAEKEAPPEAVPPVVASAPPPSTIQTVVAPPVVAPVVSAPPPPPPAPPPAARAVGGSEQATAHNIIVTGSRIPKPNLSAPNAFESKAAGGEDYSAFLSRLQAAIRANDRRSTIAMIDFPLRVNFAGDARIYGDAQAVERDFDRIFTPKVKRAVLEQRPDRLFVRDQGAMVGNGELWLRENCPSSACSPPRPIGIVAVNP